MLKRISILLLALILGACNPSSPAIPTPTSQPLTLPLMAASIPAPIVQNPPVSYKVAAFYYPWYGNPAFDTTWMHWTQESHLPPQDIASDYFPALGAYSSNDPSVVEQHMAWLRQAGIGVIIVSWWGQGSLEERPLPLILQTAERYGIKVAFHIEPYPGRTADGLARDIAFLYQRYGSSPAFFTSTAATPYSPGNKPKGMFFVWCIRYAGQCGQQKVDAGYWQAAMDQIHALPQGALIIANVTDTGWVDSGHFDGLYNYSTLHPDKNGGFTWAKRLPPGALYVPSVIPGFSAKRVAYSTDKYVARDDGKTYSDQWTAALGTGIQPELVTITSFNEWHEGSQIEPPAPGKNDGHGYNYADFGELPPDGYLAITRQWVDKLLAQP